MPSPAASAPPPFEPWRGVFETLRVVRGVPLFVAAHHAEFRAASAALGLPELSFDPTAAAAGLPDLDGRWRWIGTRAGVSSLFSLESQGARRTFSLVLSRARLGSANLDARFKTLSYLTHAQARAENPAGDAVLLNEHGELASGAMTNLFWVRGGKLFTPAVECGCRAGVTRAWLLEQAEFCLARARPRALDDADEIFVTNSLVGLQPVTSWEDRRLPAGPITRKLRRAYALACRRELLLNPRFRPNPPEHNPPAQKTSN